MEDINKFYIIIIVKCMLNGMVIEYLCFIYIHIHM